MHKCACQCISWLGSFTRMHVCICVRCNSLINTMDSALLAQQSSLDWADWSNHDVREPHVARGSTWERWLDELKPPACFV